jgi:hypothetical protein
MKRIDNAKQILFLDFRIHLRRGNIFMPKNRLNIADITPGAEQMACTCMAEYMACYLPEISFFPGSVDLTIKPHLQIRSRTK